MSGLSNQRAPRRRYERRPHKRVRHARKTPAPAPAPGGTQSEGLSDSQAKKAKKSKAGTKTKQSAEV